MILDATLKSGERRSGREGEREKGRRGKIEEVMKRLPRLSKQIREVKFVEDALLLAKVSAGGRKIVEDLVRLPELAGVKIIAAVSEDVDLSSRENSIWGVFTRFDCARDVIFTEQSLVGIRPVYRGIMGIDATWKPGYPKPLVMSEEIVERVNRRRDEYWR
jgi:4-hydroxy-3-polyprenylbenzoate decarboxylase